jgi:CheY-like chemotaxis protein
MSKLVMVIDDSATVRKVLEVTLRREGFHVVSYMNGVEAIQALTEQSMSRVPDLIMIDICLPKLDGYDVARLLKARPHLSNTAIIMISRRDGPLDKLKSRLVGARLHLVKPLTTQSVLEAVRSLLGSADMASASN